MIVELMLKLDQPCEIIEETDQIFFTHHSNFLDACLVSTSYELSLPYLTLLEAKLAGDSKHERSLYRDDLIVLVTEDDFVALLIEYLSTIFGQTYFHLLLVEALVPLESLVALIELPHEQVVERVVDLPASGDVCPEYASNVSEELVVCQVGEVVEATICDEQVCMRRQLTSSGAPD